MDDQSERMLDLVNVKNVLDLELPSVVREQCTCGASAKDFVSEPRSASDVALHVEDVKLENVDGSPLGANSCSDIIMRTMSEKSITSEHFKAANNKDNPQENISLTSAMSLPVARKLVSAMKGGREKEGLPVRKLSVSWAPDVYDPPPSLVSHLPKRNNNQSYRSSKKHGKGKQKSKSSQGSSSRSKKDKKHHHHHHRKGGEKAEPSLGLTFASDPVLATATNTGNNLSTSNNKPTIELLDFENDDESDNPNSNCGSSFLRKSCGALHLSYAERT